MKTFIQLKDNIGVAYVDTNSHTEGVEVPFGTGDFYLNKKFIDGDWEEVTPTFYAIVDENGKILQINSTYFPSDIKNNPVIDSSVDLNYIWDESTTSWIEQ